MIMFIEYVHVAVQWIPASRNRHPTPRQTQDCRREGIESADGHAHAFCALAPAKRPHFRRGVPVSFGR